MRGNNELALQNTQPTVKDGAQERFYKKCQEIQKREELSVRKEKEEKLRTARVKAQSKYFDATRELAGRWFGWRHDDFENVKRECGEIAILDKLLIRKIMKKLLVFSGGVAVSIPALYLADIVAWNFLGSLFASRTMLQEVAGVGGFFALAIGNLFIILFSAMYLKNSFLSSAFVFLRDRKPALLLHQELEKEESADGV